MCWWRNEIHRISVADPDSVGSEPFWSDPDPTIESHKTSQKYWIKSSRRKNLLFKFLHFFILRIQIRTSKLDPDKSRPYPQHCIRYQFGRMFDFSKNRLQYVSNQIYYAKKWLKWKCRYPLKQFNSAQISNHRIIHVQKIPAKGGGRAPFPLI